MGIGNGHRCNGPRIKHLGVFGIQAPAKRVERFPAIGRIARLVNKVLHGDSFLPDDTGLNSGSLFLGCPGGKPQADGPNQDPWRRLSDASQGVETRRPAKCASFWKQRRRIAIGHTRGNLSVDSSA